ncbi:hypothetical protein [uncultured Paraglaciecola sp.]|uniref:lipase family protein n=1 Tax=uncultured Paraglaciecola sp. TaxID=1765024 RepID=UPI00263439DD|nr:hypothetical protein [uncultured Paraglaciecola sp.]
MTPLEQRKHFHSVCERAYLPVDTKLPTGESFHVFGGNMVVFRQELDDVVNIAFQGSKTLPDWLQNFYAWPTKKVQHIGKFHRGYACKVIEHLQEIDTLLSTGKQNIVGGHSAGGGEGGIFAAVSYRQELITQVVTFGAPQYIRKIYSAHHENWLRQSTTHYVNPYDMVTWVPPGMQRIGKEVFKGIRVQGGSEHPLPLYAEFFKDV